jgi:prefoldin subunit 5
MNKELAELIETINVLMTEMESLKSEIKDLKVINKEMNSKLYTLNENLSTL